MKSVIKNPFPAIPFEATRLIRQIMECIDPNKSIMAYAICTAVSNKVPYRQILATIKSQGSDNPRAYIEMLGEKLWNDIKNFD